MARRWSGLPFGVALLLAGGAVRASANEGAPEAAPVYQYPRVSLALTAGIVYPSCARQGGHCTGLIGPAPSASALALVQLTPKVSV